MIMSYKTLEVILDFLKTHKDVTCTLIDTDDQIDPCSLRIRCQGISTLYFAIRPEDATYISLSSRHGKTMKLSAEAQKVAMSCEGTLDFELSNEEKAWIWHHNTSELGELGAYNQLVYFGFRIQRGRYRSPNISTGEFDIKEGTEWTCDVDGTFQR